MAKAKPKLATKIILPDGSLNRKILDSYMMDCMDGVDGVEGVDGMEGVHGVAIVPDFLKVFNIGVDHETVWRSIVDLETYDDDEELSLDPEPKLLPGSHPALRYRGNPVRRAKVWLQSDFDKGMLRYGYTGWQWRVSLAQSRIEKMPVIDSLTESLNRYVPREIQYNHVIGTVYEDHNDFISLHSDKDGDFTVGSGFLVLKLGGARRFQFSTLDGEIFYDERLEPGTAIIVSGEANRSTKHAVPKDPKCRVASGSLVWRSIKTVIPWRNVEHKIAEAHYK